MTRSAGRGRRYTGLLMSLLIAIGTLGVSAPVAQAADASVSLVNSADATTVTPGQTFSIPLTSSAPRTP